MATIGLDKLYYAKITEDENGDETYATKRLPVSGVRSVTSFSVLPTCLRS